MKKFNYSYLKVCGLLSELPHMPELHDVLLENEEKIWKKFYRRSPEKKAIILTKQISNTAKVAAMLHVILSDKTTEFTKTKYRYYVLNTKRGFAISINMNFELYIFTTRYAE